MIDGVYPGRAHAPAWARPTLIFSIWLYLSACDDPNQHRDASTSDCCHYDAVKPPDLTTGDGRSGNSIGKECDPGTSKGCTGATTCLKVTPKVGVCALPNCALEDITTPANEDNCPTTMVGATSVTGWPTVCTRVPSAGGNFCLPKCSIQINEEPRTNPCLQFHQGLACDPVSLTYNDHSEVCLFPRCKSHADCNGGSTLPLASWCDVATGLCLPLGSKGAKVGSPCKVSTDCGTNQYCYPERKTIGGKVMVEGGYCTVVGCTYGEPWTCPSGSRCFSMGSLNALSLCLAQGCNADDPPAKDKCRDEASAGQYDCIYLDKFQVCWLAPQNSK